MQKAGEESENLNKNHGTESTDKDFFKKFLNKKLYPKYNKDSQNWEKIANKN